jgi:glutathione S-transferase
VDVQSTAGSLRYWTLTGKVPQRPAALVESKRQGALKAFAALDHELAQHRFAVGDEYTIADISLFAYTHVARDADLPLGDYRHIMSWIERVRDQPRFLDKVYPYSIDPYSTRELP